MDFFVAAAPLLLAVLLIIVAGQSALRAGAVGLLSACAIVTFFDPFVLGLGDIVHSLIGGVLTTSTVSYVLLGGVIFYHVLREGGALEVLSTFVLRIIPDRGHAVLALVFGVSVFFESATGFGVGIIVVAPLFMALGFEPMRAALLALLGQCAVPWGALAIGTLLGSDLSGVSAERLGALAVPLGAPYVLATGVAALYIAKEWHPIGPRLLLLLVYCATFLALLWTFNEFVAVELAGCLTGIAVVVLAGMFGSRSNVADGDCPRVATQSLLRSFAPVALLLFGLLITRLVPGVRRVVEGFAAISFESFGFTLAPLYHSGFWLLLAALAGITTFSLSGRLSSFMGGALKQWFFATLAVGGFLCLGSVMAKAGMTTYLAGALAHAAGGAFPLVSPMIGAFGGFLTASNAASNALFMNFQMDAASRLGLPQDWIAGAHNAAGSNATLASPGRVVFAATVAGHSGAEAMLLRRVLILAILSTLGTVGVLWLALRGG